MTRLMNLGLGAMAALLASPVYAQTSDPQRYGHHAWDGPWHGWFMGPSMMIIFLLVVVVFGVVLVRWLDRPTSAHAGSNHQPLGPLPLDILKERFAKGEIDKEEFEDRRRALEKQH